MSDTDVAPIEIVVLAFPGSRFNGEIVPALAELVDDGIVRIIDLALITKHDDGTVTTLEIDEVDRDVAVAFDALDGEVTGLLSQDDLATAAAALDPGSSAVVIVWVDTWARRLTAAVRASGGHLVAHDRLDTETVSLALADAGIPG